MAKLRIAVPAEDMPAMKEALSLAGKTILITRQREQSEELTAEIEKHGGTAVVIPMIRISEPASWVACDRALASLQSFDAIVFTSANAIEKFFARCSVKGIAADAFAHIEVYAVGEKTKEVIESKGVAVKFVPDSFSSEALSEFFKSADVKGRKVLLPKGNLGKRELAETLSTVGAQVEEVDVYRNSPPDDQTLGELRKSFHNNEFDVVTFASPSAVKSFARAVPAAMVGQGTKVAVIGPTTERAAEQLGFTVDIEARESTSKGLVEAIAAYYS